MSLNFVASAVLSSGDGIGHNEETKIENEDLDNLRRKQENSSGVGLFDQLQKNKDEAEEAFNQKRSDLMGVRPLDDEDVQVRRICLSVSLIVLIRLSTLLFLSLFRVSATYLHSRRYRFLATRHF
ncbi:hypothetical protein TL16_g12050 [Triparma laevis f. inornata]|uniref:FAM192A/Fyv6 N-terminal domain-containing protein n=1 Tax=Triparma laevis f. inornata TaxID=1714386 RepID=A0A9W7BQ81_9STRA|nr:hypothetical protein TL16_g12050 [Triparma laevis f. inornata]